MGDRVPHVVIVRVIGWVLQQIAPGVCAFKQIFPSRVIRKYS
jgi:hypothetical protein